MRAGYKQTEIGLIPEDWEISILEQLASKVGSGITPRGGSNAYKLFGRPFVRSQNVGWGILKLGDIAFIDDETHETFQNTEIRFEDVFLNISGASIGRSAVANRKLIGGNVNQHVCILRAKREKLHPIFLNKILLSTIGQDQIDSFQSGGNREGLNIGQIKTFKIPLPPLPEQTAIATVLSDTDKLLQAIEKKIAKKRLIKQGAMQELLRPKEGWVVKPLGKFVNFSNGKAHENHIDINGEYTVVNSKFVSTGGRVFKSASENFSPLKKGDIVMVMSDIPNGKALAKCFLIPKDNKYALNQRICSIRTEEADTRFLFYILNRNKYYLEFDSGTGQTNLKKDDVLNCPIPLPSTKEEQTRIATILTAMDTEIETLEKQLKKYKQVKQGLMQNLLTGKIRLV